VDAVDAVDAVERKRGIGKRKRKKNKATFCIIL
jgi:hypothetical protein